MTVATNTVGRRKVGSIGFEQTSSPEPEITAFTPVYARMPTRQAGMPRAAWMLVPTVAAPARRAASTRFQAKAPLPNRSAAVLPEAPMAYDGKAAAPAQNTVTVPTEVPSQPVDPAPGPIPAPLPTPEILTVPNL